MSAAAAKCKCSVLSTAKEVSAVMIRDAGHLSFEKSPKEYDREDSRFSL